MGVRWRMNKQWLRCKMDSLGMLEIVARRGRGLSRFLRGLCLKIVRRNE